MAEDKERKALSKTSRWENELCQAAREIAEDNLDVDEAILAAVLGDRGLFVLTNRALLLMDEKKRKLLWNLPLAEIQDLRVEGRGGGCWMDWRTSGGVQKEPLVGDWSLFQQAVEALSKTGSLSDAASGVSGRVARDRVAAGHRLSPTERLRVLKQLLDEFFISETEYEEKKAEILRDL